jgi:hypothetical protein
MEDYLAKSVKKEELREALSRRCSKKKPNEILWGSWGDK